MDQDIAKSSRRNSFCLCASNVIILRQNHAQRITHHTMSESLPYSYAYPHPSVTADCVIFGFDGKALHILLVERGLEPFKGMWALPGGFLNPNETIEECARRELQEETRLQIPKDTYLEQFHVFSRPDRDPRERVLTVAFYALVKSSDHVVQGGDDALRAQWFPLEELPPLAFDHQDIIRLAKVRLQEKVRTHPIAFKLLDQKFSIPELQTLYEEILGIQYDRRNFYRKVLAGGFLAPQGTSEKAQANRRPTLYSVNEDNLEEICARATPGRFPFDF